MSGPAEADPMLYAAAETYGVFDRPHQSCIRTVDGNIIWSYDFQKKGFLGRKRTLRIFAIARGGRPVFILNERDDDFEGFVATKVMPPRAIKLFVDVDDPGTVLAIVVDEFVRQSEGIFGPTTAKRIYED